MASPHFLPSAADSFVSLEVLCPENGPGSCTIHVPRSALVSELKREACAALMLSEDDVDLYDFFGGSLYACLEDKLQQTVASVRLMDKQSVLLKGHKGPPAPRPVSTDAFSKGCDLVLVFQDGCELPVHRCVLELCSGVLQDVLSHQAPGDDRLPVPGDDRNTWMFILKLLYPCSQMRLPPITWSNVERVLQLADKYAMSVVLRVVEDFLLLPHTAFTMQPADTAYVWKWLMAADRLNMRGVVRKAMNFIKSTRVTTAMDAKQLAATLSEAVAALSQHTLSQLLLELLQAKDELRTQAAAAAAAAAQLQSAGSGQLQLQYGGSMGPASSGGGAIGSPGAAFMPGTPRNY